MVEGQPHCLAVPNVKQGAGMAGYGLQGLRPEHAQQGLEVAEVMAREHRPP